MTDAPIVHYAKVGIWNVSGKRINMNIRFDPSPFGEGWFYHLGLWSGREMKFIRVGRQETDYGPFISHADALEDAKRLALSLSYKEEVLVNNKRYQ